MFKRLLVLSALLMGSAAVSVAAQNAQDSEPVLRLRLQAPSAVERARPLLRPRFGVRTASNQVALPTPEIRMSDNGRVGTFALVSTPHPNVVIAVGAADDSSEVGRQIDRAILGLDASTDLYENMQDRAPFVGLGLQSGNANRGWSMDASIGAHLINQAEQARTFDAIALQNREGYEAEARANLRLRYKF